MEVSGQLHAPVALPPGERAPGTHSRSGRSFEKEILLLLPGIEARLPSVQSVV
jgi:hypothetical protein